MQMVLKLIRTHLISLLSGVAIIAFLTLAILGMTSDSVKTRMDEQISRTKATSIRSLMSTPVNQDIIRAEKARGEESKEDFARAQSAIQQINRREPLMDGVFPKPAGPVMPLEYRDRYVQSVLELPRTLLADTLPTDADIQEEKQNVDDLLELEREKKEEESATAEPQPAGGGAPAPPRPPPDEDDSVGLGDPLGGPMIVGAGGRRNRPRGPTGGPAGPTPSTNIPRGEPKYDPLFRARVTKARSIRCYIEPQTFHVSPLAREMTAPEPAEMWYSQVALWVQQDVVKAIAELNERALASVDSVEFELEHVPVKRLAAIRVFGYELSSGVPIRFRTASDVGPGPFNPAEQAVSFTGRASDDKFDVLRFGVRAVVDQRRLLDLVDAITKANLYQCVGMKYEAVDRAVEETQLGYFYGTAPVVLATLEFEAYMAREAYASLMPPEVVAVLRGTKPEGE